MILGIPGGGISATLTFGFETGVSRHSEVLFRQSPLPVHSNFFCVQHWPTGLELVWTGSILCRDSGKCYLGNFDSCFGSVTVLCIDWWFWSWCKSAKITLYSFYYDVLFQQSMLPVHSYFFVVSIDQRDWGWYKPAAYFMFIVLWSDISAEYIAGSQQLLFCVEHWPTGLKLA